MLQTTKSETRLTAHPVWDRTTRVFHWINALCVLALAVFGLAILNAKTFGVSADGKILLKTLHSYVGYVFAINLSWRLVWAFIGNPHARWSAILPGRHGFGAALKAHLRGLFTQDAPVYLGHNPLGRLMVSGLLLLLLTQALTGLILAGTDLYQPPFGGAIAQWVTNGDAEKLANLTPGSKAFVDAVAYDDMRAFRKPIVTIHLYAFYVLMVAILLHVIGVIVAEVRERSGIISAMVTGDKVLRDKPSDTTNDSHQT